MAGNNTINAQQIIVNVSDTIPPENLATIDKGSLIGNAVSKEQFQNQFDAKSVEIDEKFEELKDQVESAFKGILSPDDPAPTEDGSYKPSTSSEDDKPTDPNSTADWGKTYPNAGNLRAKTGYDTMFYKKGDVWAKAETKMPINPAEQVFDPNDNVKPATMKATSDASELLVNKAFEGLEMVSETIGWDLTGVNTTNIPSNQSYIFGNNVFATKTGVVSLIRANFEEGGLVTAVVFSVANNQVSISSQFDLTVVPGENALNVDIPLQVGQSIGWLKTASLKLKYTDGTVGRSYLSNGQNPPNVSIYTGYMAYNFVLNTEITDHSFTVESIKEKLTKGFVERSFSHELNFTGDFCQRYTKIFNTVTLKSGTKAEFGKMNYLRLTGGNLNLDVNFIPQSGTASYIPTKTNLITTWYEYGKVRYLIENFDLEPIVFNSKTKTFYDFTNKGANTQLSSITVDYGLPFTGKVSYWKINSAGTMLTSTTAASSLQTDAISIDKGDLTDYKVTLFMGFGAHFIVSPNDATGGTFTDYIRFIKGSPNTIVRHTSPSGNVDTATTLVPAVATTGYLWEIEVKGNAIKIFVNSGLAYEGITTQAGNFFSIAFTGVGDFISSILLEEL